MNKSVPFNDAYDLLMNCDAGVTTKYVSTGILTVAP
jgi:hypothetical protein